MTTHHIHIATLKRFGQLLLLLLLIISCQARQTATYTKVNGFTQGTTFNIIYSDSAGRDFSKAFDSIFHAVDRSMSVYNDSSIISRLNRNEIDTVDALLAEVIAISDSIYHETDGAFDITVGPVVRALGFGPEQHAGIDSAQIRALQRLIGMGKINMAGNRLQKDDPKIQIDVNAVAQGYTSDLVARFLSSKGISNFMVEVGGEIMAMGISSRGTPWIVGIDKPVENALPGENLQAKFYFSGSRGMSTSGNYRKFIEVNGIKYAHTINPKTGFPAMSNLLSATVIAPTAARADALATAFMVNGLEWSRNFVNSHTGVEAYLIYSDSTGKFNEWVSEGLKSSIAQ
ncbi:MAG TPA: FAD:protein FMN transferase [Tenuifilaceae bacterium]|nr:FAD:protein FMN transferase [Tenuifilaceae bacterium]